MGECVWVWWCWGRLPPACRCNAPQTDQNAWPSPAPCYRPARRILTLRAPPPRSRCRSSRASARCAAPAPAPTATPSVGCGATSAARPGCTGRRRGGQGGAVRGHQALLGSGCQAGSVHAEAYRCIEVPVTAYITGNTPKHSPSSHTPHLNMMLAVSIRLTCSRFSHTARAHAARASLSGRQWKRAHIQMAVASACVGVFGVGGCERQVPSYQAGSGSSSGSGHASRWRWPACVGVGKASSAGAHTTASPPHTYLPTAPTHLRVELVHVRQRHCEQLTAVGGAVDCSGQQGRAGRSCQIIARASVGQRQPAWLKLHSSIPARFRPASQPNHNCESTQPATPSRYQAPN